MLPFLITISIIIAVAACNSKSTKVETGKDSREFPLEPEEKVRKNLEADRKPTPGCIFLDPDTSISKIKLRDFKSAETIIDKKDKIDSNDQYHYYSKLNREMLTLTQHPGDSKHEISIIRVQYSDKANLGPRNLTIDTFKTEKGIKLGLNKKQIVDRLGSCYVVQDSSKGYFELYYRLEKPNDSGTKILGRSSMPIYYASYKLRNDRLEMFEFGFEYP